MCGEGLGMRLRAGSLVTTLSSVVAMVILYVFSLEDVKSYSGSRVVTCPLLG